MEVGPRGKNAYNTKPKHTLKNRPQDAHDKYKNRATRARVDYEIVNGEWKQPEWS